jgi:hypothetical protein
MLFMVLFLLERLSSSTIQQDSSVRHSTNVDHHTRAFLCYELVTLSNGICSERINRSGTVEKISKRKFSHCSN